MDVELVRHRPTRITAALANKITSAIPNRLAYFDSQNLDMYPIVIRPRSNGFDFGTRSKSNYFLLGDEFSWIHIAIQEPAKFNHGGCVG
jgi:hypothetical protein